MARIEVSGLEIAYELIGREGAPAVSLTPGGRFNKETPGLRELAEELASGGHRVLIWDRPNCGASDVCFDADSEPELHGRTLTRLIRALDLGPTAIVGGSSGSRSSLIAASRDPEIVSHLCVLWITGEPIGLMGLVHYSADPALAASKRGMEAVAALPDFAEQIEKNPRNRDIILRQEPEAFIATMQRWAMFFSPSPDSPVPGMSPDDFARLTMPTLVFRSGKSDIHHTRRTSEWVHELIPHSRLVEPPWPENEWNDRTDDLFAGKGRGLFENWPLLAPQLLEFLSRQQ